MFYFLFLVLGHLLLDSYLVILLFTQMKFLLYFLTYIFNLYFYIFNIISIILSNYFLDYILLYSIFITFLLNFIIFSLTFRIAFDGISLILNLLPSLSCLYINSLGLSYYLTGRYNTS